MTTTVQAIYEHGVLRLSHALPFAEGARVEVTVAAPDPVPLHGSPADILDAIAALPLETQGEEADSRDHDHILYGGAGAK